jgi:hypothetical protein
MKSLVKNILLAFGGWLTMGTYINPDGTINVAWPVHWNNGQPALVTPFAGAQGHRYDAAEDFSYLREKYPMRKLDAPTSHP